MDSVGYVFDRLRQNTDSVPILAFDVNTVYKSMTLLHLACMTNNPRAVEWLIRRGANINLATEDGFTAVHWAAMRGHPDCLKLLLEAKAKVDPLSITDWTPLSRAIWRKQSDKQKQEELLVCIKLLISHGAHIGLVKKDFRPAEEDIRLKAYHQQTGDTVRDWIESERELFLEWSSRSF